MASSAQLRANRHNAKKSTGPKTAGGMMTSSQNAKRHGITGKAKESDIYAAAVSLGLGGDAGDPQSLKLAAAQLRVNHIRAERNRGYLSLYDWLFGDEPSHFEARLMREISETIEDFKLDPEYLFSREYFRDEEFRLKMAGRLATPAFLNLLRLNDRYLDEAQSKRRAAIRSLTRDNRQNIEHPCNL
jgi:hypothetical protein